MGKFFAYSVFARHILRFRRLQGYWPNVAFPKTAEERFYWRKVFDHNPAFEIFCDKYECKKYVKSICPELAVPRTLWIGERFEDVPEEYFRSGVAFKTTHACNQYFLLRDASFDRTRMQTRFREWLKVNHGKVFGEWGYFSVKPRVMIEELIEESTGGACLDIGVRVANGRAVFSNISVGTKTPDKRQAFFLPDGTRFNPRVSNPLNSFDEMPDSFTPPDTYADAIRFARELSRGIDYVRVDFLSTKHKLYAGEITVYPGGGGEEPPHAPKADKLIRSNWDLRDAWFLRTQHAGWRSEYAHELIRHANRLAKAGGA